jgi:hypothetical protein
MLDLHCQPWVFPVGRFGKPSAKARTVCQTVLQEKPKSALYNQTPLLFSPLATLFSPSQELTRGFFLCPQPCGAYNHNGLGTSPGPCVRRGSRGRNHPARPRLAARGLSGRPLNHA